MPKVSVLTPLYRPPEDYLREMMESVLHQTFSDFEFILLNDCPEDTATDEIVASYGDERIVYLKNETNLGIAASRNLLIEKAKGEYLAVVDHDDVSLETRLQKEVKFLDEHPNCGVVSSWYQKMYGKRNLVRKRPETNAEIVAAMSEGCAVIHPAAMIRKSVLNQFHIRYEPEFSPAAFPSHGGLDGSGCIAFAEPLCLHGGRGAGAAPACDRLCLHFTRLLSVAGPFPGLCPAFGGTSCPMGGRWPDISGCRFVHSGVGRLRLDAAPADCFPGL